MARFKPGQEVVCIDDRWTFMEKFMHFFYRKKVNKNAPKKDEIVTVESYVSNVHVFLKEYPARVGMRDCFHESGFEPIISSEEIEELMKEVNEPQKA